MNDFKIDIDECCKVLAAGELILYPADTIWGIGCDATNDDAVEKIFSLKQRHDKRSMIILVADEKNIFTYVENPDKKLFDYLSSAKKTYHSYLQSCKKCCKKSYQPGWNNCDKNCKR